MNTLSSACGIILIPLAGIAWEFFPGLIVYRVLGIGTFNPITWIATFLMAVLINAILEWALIRFYFNVDKRRRPFLWLVVANSASVAVAMISLIIVPART